MQDIFYNLDNTPQKKTTVLKTLKIIQHQTSNVLKGTLHFLCLCLSISKVSYLTSCAFYMAIIPKYHTFFAFLISTLHLDLLIYYFRVMKRIQNQILLSNHLIVTAILVISQRLIKIPLQMKLNFGKYIIRVKPTYNSVSSLRQDFVRSLLVKQSKRFTCAACVCEIVENILSRNTRDSWGCDKGI